MASTSSANNTCLSHIRPACLIPLKARREENCRSACERFSLRTYHSIIGISNTNNRKYFGFANSNPNISFHLQLTNNHSFPALSPLPSFLRQRLIRFFCLRLFLFSILCPDFFFCFTFSLLFFGGFLLFSYFRLQALVRCIDKIVSGI